MCNILEADENEVESDKLYHSVNLEKWNRFYTPAIECVIQSQELCVNSTKSLWHMSSMYTCLRS